MCLERCYCRPFCIVLQKCIFFCVTEPLCTTDKNKVTLATYCDIQFIVLRALGSVTAITVANRLNIIE
jgi:hypothetical protein